jgi:hypothetical protein
MFCNAQSRRETGKILLPRLKSRVQIPSPALRFSSVVQGAERRARVSLQRWSTDLVRRENVGLAWGGEPGGLVSRGITNSPRGDWQAPGEGGLHGQRGAPNCAGVGRLHCCRTASVCGGRDRLARALLGVSNGMRDARTPRWRSDFSDLSFGAELGDSARDPEHVDRGHEVAP